MNNFGRFSSLGWGLSLCCLLMFCPSLTFAQGGNDWTIDNENPAYPGKTVLTKNLVLYPAKEPRPALRYRLLPSDYDQLEGNAAINYLRAIGFPELNNVRRELDRIAAEANKISSETGVGIDRLPPLSWQGMLPAELPLEEVRKYLELTEFQHKEIAAAFRLKNLDFNRQFREVESPMLMLLPEIQAMRELARTQSLRCRLAIAEGRLEDALMILAQQTRLASHLNQEPLVVTNLVAIAIFGINWSDALDFVQHPGAPNLYWALAALPRPLLPFDSSFSFEREWFSLELKELGEVDETWKPAGYWQVFLDRILPRYNQLLSAGSTGEPMSRQDLVHLIAAGYPGAKRYLIEEEKMDPTSVESYTTAQTFFLAQKKYSDYAMDEWIKWSFVDFHSLLADPGFQERIDERLNQEAGQFGVMTHAVQFLMPAVPQIRQAAARAELQIAMLMGVEGIRLFASQNQGKLPAELSLLPYPLPFNPFTGQALQYETSGDRATLTGTAGNQIIKLNLQISESSE